MTSLSSIESAKAIDHPNGPERIWYEDPIAAFSLSNYTHVLPESSMTDAEKMNSIFRITVYLSIALTLFRADTRYLFIAIVGGLVTGVLYGFQKREKFEQQQNLDKQSLQISEGKVCKKPNPNNPFMNVRTTDYGTNIDPEPACDVDNTKVEKQMKDAYYARMFRDVGDVFENMHSFRQFYTMPSSTIPNDQTAFAKWRFENGPSCKDGNGEQCYRNMYDPINP